MRQSRLMDNANNIMEALRFGENQMVMTIAEPKHLEEEFVYNRRRQLSRIDSEHFLRIEEIQPLPDKKSILVTYKPQPCTPLQTVIRSYELYPSQIKAIVWQITRIMLECERLKVNHLRLSPKTIALGTLQMDEQKHIKKQGVFVWLKEFSLGREFLEVQDGKHLSIFQFMHPQISLRNGFKDFKAENYDSSFDIWSLGVVLYYLCYRKSPFRKPGRECFSKTILREFLEKRQEIVFSRRFGSVNELIGLCLRAGSWKEVRDYLVREEEVFNEIDFVERPFAQTCELQVRVMYLFSSVYCLIVEECRSSPHHTWQTPISQLNASPFGLLAAESTLVLMHHIHARFLRLYSSHFHLLQSRNNRRLREMVVIGQSVEAQRANLKGRWLVGGFEVKREAPLTGEMVKAIQVQFARVKMESGVNRKRARDGGRFSVSGMGSGTGSAETRANSGQYSRELGWRSIEVLFDFCDEMIQILNQSRDRMKKLFELVYTSEVLKKLAVEDFGYPTHSQMSMVILPEESLRRKR